jgi:hypothetical protein
MKIAVGSMFLLVSITVSLACGGVAEDAAQVTSKSSELFEIYGTQNSWSVPVAPVEPELTPANGLIEDNVPEGCTCHCTPPSPCATCYGKTCPGTCVECVYPNKSGGLEFPSPTPYPFPFAGAEMR